MKFALPLLLSGALALAPWSCNRGNAPNESVSANSDQTQRSEQTEQNQTTKSAKPPNTNREPEKQPVTSHCQNHSSSSASGVFNPSKNRSKRAPTPPPIRNH